MIRRTFVIATVFVFLPLVVFSQATITVMNSNPSGPGSLTQAYLDIDPGGTINFDPSVTGQMPLNEEVLKDVTIVGNDPSNSIRSGLGVTGSKVVIRNIFVQGGVIVKNSGDLLVENGGLSCNYTCQTAVLSNSKLTLKNTTFYRAESLIDDIQVSGNSTLIVDGSRLWNNISNYRPPRGIIDITSGTVEIKNNSVIGHTISNRGGELFISDSFLYEDGVCRSCGGINQTAGSFEVDRSELSDSGAYGFTISGGTGKVSNSRLFWPLCLPGNSTEIEISSSYINYLNIENCTTLNLHSNIIDQSNWTNADLQDLVDNYFNIVEEESFPGSMDALVIYNHAERIWEIDEASPAIDQGDCSLNTSTLDYNGNPRLVDTYLDNAPGGDGCDIGPWEAQSVTAPDTLIVTTDTRFINGSLEWVLEHIADGGTVLFDPSVSNKDIFLIQAVNRDVIIDGQNQDITIRAGGGVGVDGADVTMKNLRYFHTNFGQARLGVGNQGHLRMEDLVIDCLHGCLDVDNANLSLTNVQATITEDEWFVTARNQAEVTIDSTEIQQLDTSVFEKSIEMNDSDLFIINDSKVNGWVQSYNGTTIISNSWIGGGGTTAFYGFRQSGGDFTVSNSFINGIRFGLRVNEGTGLVSNSAVTSGKDGFSCGGGSVDIYNSTLTTQDPSTWKGLTVTDPCVVNLYSSLALETESSSISQGGIDNAFNLIVDTDLTPYIDPLLVTDANYGYLIRPSISSPLIDQGDCALTAVTIDLLGEARPFDEPSILNAPGGDGCDIGAIEGQGVAAEILVDLKIILSGAWTGTEMRTELNDANLIPLDQPYSDVPSVSVSQTFMDAHPEIVDWIWIELRTGLHTASSLFKQAAFVTSDGAVIGVDGQTSVSLNASPGPYHIVIGHRNHLPVITANPASLSAASAVVIDLMNDPALVYSTGGNALKDLGGSSYGLWGGDGNADGDVTAFDFIQSWLPQNGTNGYLSGDFDLGGAVTAFDFLQVWLVSNGQASQVP